MKLDKQSELRKKLKKMLVIVLIILAFLVAIYLVVSNLSIGQGSLESLRDSPIGWVFKIADRMGWFSALIAFFLVSITVYFTYDEYEKKKAKQLNEKPVPEGKK
ncbi:MULTISPECIES: hypothetical protein [Bacillota]|uniref:hypothetical protein n=1 Tax=Bacillota TaxID=1239 RepID=UPI0039F00C38